MLRLARERSLDVALAREMIDEQAAVRRGARAQALPNLGLAAGVARLNPNIATVAGVPAGRAWLLIAPGRVYFDVKAAKFAVRAAGAGADAATQDVLLQAAALYYNLQLSVGLVRVSDQAVAAAEELARRAQELREEGIALLADVLRARAQLALEEQNRVEARKNLRLASIDLATLLRLPPDVQLVPREEQLLEIAPAQEPARQLVGRALDQRPELDRADAESAAARARRQGAFWGAVIPVIGLERWFGGVTTDTPQPDRRTWFYSEWRFLDNLGQSAKSRIQQAKSQQRQADLRREALEDQIAAQVLAARQEVLAAGERIQVAQQEVEAAGASLRMFQERYENGLGTQLDVLAGQEAATRARQNLVQAVVRYNLSQAELVTRLGDRLPAAVAPE